MPAEANPAPDPGLWAKGTVTVPELKRRYGIAKAQAYQLMAEGRLRYAMPLGRRLISVASVEALLESGLAPVGS